MTMPVHVKSCGADEAAQRDDRGLGPAHVNDVAPRTWRRIRGEQLSRKCHDAVCALVTDRDDAPYVMGTVQETVMWWAPWRGGNEQVVRLAWTNATKSDEVPTNTAATEVLQFFAKAVDAEASVLQQFISWAETEDQLEQEIEAR